MTIQADDWLAIALTLKLATTSTLLLLVLSLPLSWWLAHSKSRLKPMINALVALPLVLPPTVLGFYLLMMMGPSGPLGQVTQLMGIDTLAFSFWGIVIASMIYSLPFVVQPLQTTFAAIGHSPLELASTMGAGFWDRIRSVILPMSRSGILIACILGFAHTLGEFGVVLMVGGNIPGISRVISVQIYDHVEAMEYGAAHWLSGGMLLFSFITLTLVYSLNRQQKNTMGFQ